MPQFSGRHGRDEIIENYPSFANGFSAADISVEDVTVSGTLTLGAANLGAAATAATYVAGTAPVMVANQAYAAMTIGGTAYKILLFK